MTPNNVWGESNCLLEPDDPKKSTLPRMNSGEGNDALLGGCRPLISDAGATSIGHWVHLTMSSILDESTPSGRFHHHYEIPVLRRDFFIRDHESAPNSPVDAVGAGFHILTDPDSSRARYSICSRQMLIATGSQPERINPGPLDALAGRRMGKYSECTHPSPFKSLLRM